MGVKTLVKRGVAFAAVLCVVVNVGLLLGRSSPPCWCPPSERPSAPPPEPILLSSPCAEAELPAAASPRNPLRSVVRQLRDYNLPVRLACPHPWHIRFRLRPTGLPTNRSVLPVLVKSAVGRGAQRERLRGSWARRQGWEEAVLGAEPFFVFVVGEGDEAEQRAVQREAELHGDVVQAPFHDAHYNNTLKTLSELQWLATSGLRFRWALLADDDSYVSKWFLGAGVDRLESGEGPDGWCLAGDIQEAVKPIRSEGSKWHVSEAAFPRSVYPPVPRGPLILVSRAAVAELFLGSFFVERLVLDYVYLGLVAEALGRGLAQLPGLSLGGWWDWWTGRGWVATHESAATAASLKTAEDRDRQAIRSCAKLCHH